MDVVALVSGGKDSCYTILKAQALGHRVVVLAHISPPCEEPDSMMYQSVGSSAVPLIAESLGLPLIIKQTHAKAKSTELTYHSIMGDEVEDLVSLLYNVKSKFQTVQAVSSGALWSDYQRLRVEYAASTVGLLSLAPLWRRNQDELLDEMIACGIDAVLIKVAGIGLNDTHLGKSLSEMRPLLHRLEKLYGSHICGEGGEYETFVRWMPGFQKRIELGTTEKILHSYDSIAPVSFLRFHSPSLTSTNLERNTEFESVPLRKSSLFRFNPIYYDNHVEDGEARVFNRTSISKSKFESIGKSSNFLHLVLFSLNDGQGGVKDVCQRMTNQLFELKLSLKNVVSVQLHLQQVHGSSYREANEAYKETFGADIITIPPVRACVGVPDGNCGTTMEVLVRRGERKGAVYLHVQSLSEWAPPCIGPYAQYVEEDGMVYISGILPLYPPTASIPDGMSAELQVRACFNNLVKTLEAGQGKVENIAIFIVYMTTPVVLYEITQVLFDVIPNKQSIHVIVPVRALPKNALVEVKAIGSIEQSGMSDIKLSGKEPDFEFESTSCRIFIYVILKCWTKNFDIEKKVREVIRDISKKTLHDQGFRVQPLALQLYCGRHVSEESINQLCSQLQDVSICTFWSMWMPHDTQWIATLTMCRVDVKNPSSALNSSPSCGTE